MATGRKAKWIGAAAVLMTAALVLSGPPPTLAQDDVGDLKEQMKLLQEQMKNLQEKIETIEENEEEIDELADRVSKTEMHTATDKVSFSIDFRNRVDTIHYDDIRMAPEAFLDAFFAPFPAGDVVPGLGMTDLMGQMMQSPLIQSIMTPDQFLQIMDDPGLMADMLSDPEMQPAIASDPVLSQLFADPNQAGALLTAFQNMGPMGLNGATREQAQALMGLMRNYDLVPDAEKRDADNDKAFTTKLHLDMKARVNNHLDFGGRLAVYKVWGDSTGVKFNNGSLGDVTFDGNTTSLPHGDTVRLERAYFNVHGDVGRVPMNFS